MIYTIDGNEYNAASFIDALDQFAWDQFEVDTFYRAVESGAINASDIIVTNSDGISQSGEEVLAREELEFQQTLAAAHDAWRMDFGETNCSDSAVLAHFYL